MQPDANIRPLYSGDLANNVLDEHIFADVVTLFIFIFKVHSLTS